LHLPVELFGGEGDVVRFVSAAAWGGEERVLQDLICGGSGCLASGTWFLRIRALSEDRGEGGGARGAALLFGVQLPLEEGLEGLISGQNRGDIRAAGPLNALLLRNLG